MPAVGRREFHPYYWGDDEVADARPNLKFGAVEVRRYKHPMRGSSLNVKPRPKVLIPWFESVIAVICAVER